MKFLLHTYILMFQLKISLVSYINVEASGIFECKVSKARNSIIK